MKPLVYWCRWHEARLLLHGRSPQAVWGELAFADHSQSFRFDLQTQQLTLGAEPDERTVQLDEMGVEVESG
jgi:hypothetical protein